MEYCHVCYAGSHYLVAKSISTGSSCKEKAFSAKQKAPSFHTVDHGFNSAFHLVSILHKLWHCSHSLSTSLLVLPPSSFLLLSPPCQVQRCFTFAATISQDVWNPNAKIYMYIVYRHTMVNHSLHLTVCQNFSKHQQTFSSSAEKEYGKMRAQKIYF